MDYWIADEVLVPAEAQSHFVETVWRLPRVWVSYQGREDSPEVKWKEKEGGEIWLGSFNNLGKLTPETLSLWAKVLHEVPKAKLLLKTKALEEALNRQRIEEAFKAHGIEANRLELRGNTKDWTEHMDLYNQVDIALDPVGGVGGGTTTCDALWMGVPIVTQAGERMVQRMTASMLSALGRPEWVAQSEEDYIPKVRELANDREGRAQAREGQRQRMRQSALCDAKGLAGALEDAYEAMYDRWWENKGRAQSQAQPEQQPEQQARTTP